MCTQQVYHLKGFRVWNFIMGRCSLFSIGLKMSLLQPLLGRSKFHTKTTPASSLFLQECGRKKNR